MKTKLFNLLTIVILFLIPGVNLAQAPNLGTAANFVLFTTTGAVTNAGISQLTGNVGANSGAGTGFGNVNGVMCAGNAISAQCAVDLLVAYNQLNNDIPTLFPAPLLGNGDTLVAGIYSIPSTSTLNNNLILNAQGNANAVFIFQIGGAFTTNLSSKIILINGAMACNVFWKVEGVVTMASGTTMRGTIIANNAAIYINPGDTIEGRALSTTGAITVIGLMAYTPIGCGSPFLTGPMAPTLDTTVCYALFSSTGAVSNTGITYVTGDVGTNVGLTLGFNAADVNGTIHLIPDGSTAVCAANLLTVYTYLDELPYDIQLVYPAQFGNSQVLTPHTYLLNAATVLTGNLYLNAEENPNAIFIFQVVGAFSAATYSNIILMNGAQAKNVYWVINGAVIINTYSSFIGTIVCNNGAINLTAGVSLDGRALTTGGAVATNSIHATMTPGCTSQGTLLPITLISFSGADSEQVAAIHWITATETGLKYFEVERSVNGSDFITLDKQNAHNTGWNYHFNDTSATALNGTFYYRLKITDDNDNATYFWIISVNVTTVFLKTITVFPNPNSGNSFSVNLNGIVCSQINVKLFSVDGRTIELFSVNTAGATTPTLLVQLSQQLTPGLYIIECAGENGIATSKMIVY